MHTKPVRVLILIDHLHTGGAQEFLVQLCQQLHRSQVQISVCALRAGGPYVERLDRLGIPVICLAPSVHPAWRAFALARLGQLLRSGRYAVIHTLLEGSFLVGTPLAWIAGVPTLHSLMAIRRQVPGWYFPLMRWYQPLVHAYCSPVPAELIEGGIQSERILNVEVAIDVSDLLRVERDRAPITGIDVAPADLVVASIGRLFPSKGHDLVVAAWPQVRRALPNARLLIVGDGAEEARLHEQVAALDLTDHVKIVGFRSDLAAILARTNIYVRASRDEGVNLTTIQAMAAGLPSVGFANLVPKEIIVDQCNGLLVPPYDVDALADAVIRLAQDSALYERIAYAARSGVRSYYDVSLIIDQYARLYDALALGQALRDIPDMPIHDWPFV
jgi:glycosyltransferase involved in cell wall biosynthesis